MGYILDPIGGTLSGDTVIFKFSSTRPKYFYMADHLISNSNPTGSANIFHNNSGFTGTQLVVTGIPTDGRRIYVSLWVDLAGAPGGAADQEAYYYNAATILTAPPAYTGPTTIRLKQGQAATTALSWTNTTSMAVQSGSLPTGLSISGLNITGTPTAAAGTYTVTIRGTGSGGTTDVVISFVISTATVAAPLYNGPDTISAPSGSNISELLDVSNATTCQVLFGPLAPGLALSGFTLVGTPTASGTYDVTFRATGQGGILDFRITIDTRPTVSGGGGSGGGTPGTIISSGIARALTSADLVDLVFDVGTDRIYDIDGARADVVEHVFAGNPLRFALRAFAVDMLFPKNSTLRFVLKPAANFTATPYIDISKFASADVAIMSLGEDWTASELAALFTTAATKYVDLLAQFYFQLADETRVHSTRPILFRLWNSTIGSITSAGSISPPSDVNYAAQDFEDLAAGNITNIPAGVGVGDTHFGT